MSPSSPARQTYYTPRRVLEPESNQSKSKGEPSGLSLNPAPKRDYLWPE